MSTRTSSPYAHAAHGPRERPALFRWALRLVALALAVALAAVWLAILRPVSLGGPAGYTIVAGPSMSPTLESGDLVVTMHQDSYELGDVVVYEIPAGEPAAGVDVIHRIVGGSEERGFVVKGDNKDGVDPWRPTIEDIVGQVRVTVPRGGEVLLFLRSPLGFAILAGLLTLLVALARVGSSADDHGRLPARRSRWSASGLRGRLRRPRGKPGGCPAPPRRT